MKPGVRYSLRVVAFFLIAGGLLGIINSIQIGQHFAHLQQTDKVISAAAAVLVFLWSIFVGLSLWRLRPLGLRWATILFALQVFQVTISHITYEFSTFFSLRLMAGTTTHRIGADLGSSCNLYWSAQPLGWMLGINIVAVVILWFLVRVTYVE